MICTVHYIINQLTGAIHFNPDIRISHKGRISNDLGYYMVFLNFKTPIKTNLTFPDAVSQHPNKGVLPPWTPGDAKKVLC